MDRRLQVGEWTVEPGLARISGPGGRIHLEPKVMQVLLELAAQPRQVVGKDELMAAVWGGAHVVDEVLARSMSLLRQALGDDARQPRYVETIPKRGYRLIAEVRSDPGARHEEPSIAVLPLANLSGDLRQDYLADGITELLITDLSKIGSLRVISRTSVMHFKGSDELLPEIARQLGVTSIVEGSVSRADDRIRITAQLIDAATDSHLWAETYERPVSDVLTLQAEIAATVAGEVSAQLTPGERTLLAAARAVDPAAYDLYLKGLFAWSRRSPAGFAAALDLFAAAIAADPQWALPHSGLADTHIVRALYGLVPPVEAIEPARNACHRALELDDRLGQAHISLAAIQGYFDWDLAGAERALRYGIELIPSHPIGRLGLADMLTAQDRHDEALAQMSAALSLNPFDAGMNMNLGDHLVWAGRCAESLASFERALEINPRFQRAWLRLARAAACAGAREKAEFALAKAAEVAGDEVVAIPGLATVEALLGRAREARARLDTLPAPAPVSPLDLAEARTALGETDEAFACLERAIAARSGWLIFLAVDPVFAPLHGDPRFASCLERVGLAGAS
jgi:TolB-like protein/Flp pilus assembly protein TadD